MTPFIATQVRAQAAAWSAVELRSGVDATLGVVPWWGPLMSAAELNSQTIDELRPLAVDRISVLLGAGASAAAGLPGWDRLAERLLTESNVVSDSDEAKAFLARQDAMLAAEAAKASASDWPSVLRKALYGGDEEPEPAVLHLAAAALAASSDAGMVQLHTLNFDPLLGTALRRALDEVGSVAQVHQRAESAQGRAGRYVVNHLHGILPADPGEPARGIVLTLSDFTELGARPRPWQVSALQDSLQKGPLVLAGTSYRDPDIRQWLHDTERDHEVVVLLARQGLGLDRETFDRVRPALEAQWKAIDVRPIAMHDHADAAQALRELPQLNDAGYRSPRDRAQTVWTAQLATFDDVQRQHSEQLRTDLDRLRVHLGPESNLTLWLADGGGHLVRWAAPDRIYVDPDRLRFADVEHDSPWVAGRCLGRDDLLAVNLEGPRGVTQRWRSVVAAPVGVEVAGGPGFSSGVLTSASPDSLDEHDLEQWQETLIELAIEWGLRLGGPYGARGLA